MAYIKTSMNTATPARHTMVEIPISTSLDWALNPVMLYQGAGPLTAVSAIALISEVAITNGLTAVTYTVEIHTQNVQNPVTADTKLITNVMAAPLSAGLADVYQALDWGRHGFLPIRAIVPKAAVSPSIQQDAEWGTERYDIVLRASAKPAQTSGTLYVRLLHFDYIEGDFTPGTTASCCTIGFTPSNN